MKYTNYLKLIALILIISDFGVFAKLKHKKKSQGININDVKSEYLTQNTAKYVLGNNLARSDFEANPDRYILVSGKDAASDDRMKTGKVYEKDQTAYYPYTSNNNPTPSIPKTNEAAKMRYGSNSVYSLDQKPYYSPTPDSFRVVANLPKDQVAVPIQFGDLSRTHVDEKNLKKLETELASLDTPESYNSVSASGKYVPDAKAYYDPTTPAREMAKQQLKRDIKYMKYDMLHPEMPEFKFEKIDPSPKVQNYSNSNREETNEFIANSYHYPILKDQKGNNIAGPVGSNTPQVFEGTHTEIPSGNYKTYNDLVQDGSIIGVSPQNERQSSKIVPGPGVVIGTPLQKAEVKRKDDTKVNPNSKYEEAEEQLRVTAEAEDVGVVLGDKYVKDEKPMRKRQVGGEDGTKKADSTSKPPADKKDEVKKVVTPLKKDEKKSSTEKKVENNTTTSNPVKNEKKAENKTEEKKIEAEKKDNNKKEKKSENKTEVKNEKKSEIKTEEKKIVAEKKDNNKKEKKSEEKSEEKKPETKKEKKSEEKAEVKKVEEKKEVKKTEDKKEVKKTEENKKVKKTEEKKELKKTEDKDSKKSDENKEVKKSENDAQNDKKSDSKENKSKKNKNEESKAKSAEGIDETKSADKTAAAPKNLRTSEIDNEESD